MLDDAPNKWMNDVEDQNQWADSVEDIGSFNPHGNEINSDNDTEMGNVTYNSEELGFNEEEEQQNKKKDTSKENDSDEDSDTFFKTKDNELSQVPNESFLSPKPSILKPFNVGEKKEVSVLLHQSKQTIRINQKLERKK